MLKILQFIRSAFNAVRGAIRALIRVFFAVLHWIQLRLYAWSAIALICLQSLFARTRMSHDNGIATRGRVRFLDELAGVPENDFFTPGREFRARCRFAAVSYLDDARLVARGASLKFADSEYKSPLDLLMNTGHTTPFWNARTFWQFMWLTMRGRAAHAIPYMKADPIQYAGCLGPLRRNPETFAQLNYRTKIPYTFTATDNRPRYVKFRLAPWDRGEDTGLPEPQDSQDWAWCWQGIRPGETRSPNYLKEELKQRLAKGPIRFHLQIAFHEIRPGDSDDLRNSSIAWNETTHPWHDLAEVEIDEMLDFRTSNVSLFSIRNRPACMGIERARTIDDPAGMNYLRDLAIWPRRMRLLGNRLFGIPKPFSDHRELGPDTHYTPFKVAEDFGPPKPLLLPQNENPAEQANRRQELGLLREEYVLKVAGDLPTCIEALPAAEAFDADKIQSMWEDVEGTKVELGLGAVQRLFVNDGRPAESLKSFDALYPIRPIPPVHKFWRDDAEYARQRLNGVHPAVIELCRAIPGKFPVTDEMVAGLLPPGSTLAQEVASEKLFLLDYPLLDGLPTNAGQYLAAAVCLLHQESDGTLLPIAIQLAQDPKESPIFTPLDPPWLWLAVKAYAQSADAHYHEIVTHLLRTHMILEPIWLCARRHLHSRHPLLELLAPHFKFTLAINHDARNMMLVPGGPLPTCMAAGYEGSIELLKRSFKDYGFHSFDLLCDLERRGMDKKDADGHYKVPRYHYRDDGIVLANAIGDWVREMIGLYYKSDEDVRADWELQAWVEELADPKRGNLSGLPDGGKVRSIEVLVDLVSLTILKASGEHSAANNGQYDYFGYVPNVPGLMRKAPPRDKKELTERWLVEALPDFFQSAIQIAMVHLLSQQAPPGRVLGFFDDSFFAGHSDAILSSRRFRAHLDLISANIRARNAELPVPYRYLDPRRVSQSTEI